MDVSKKYVWKSDAVERLVAWLNEIKTVVLHQNIGYVSSFHYKSVRCIMKSDSKLDNTGNYR